MENSRPSLQRYFGQALGIQAQSFNLLAAAGIAVGVIAAISSALLRVPPVHILINLAASALASILFRIANHTGRFRLCCGITVIVVFLLAFPVLFFTSGGYKSGMPCFFVFAFVFTALMLDGKARIAAILAEAFVYIGSCIVAFAYPETVFWFGDELALLTDMLVGIVVVGLLLLLVVVLYVRIYRNCQERIDAQNAVLAEMNSRLGQTVGELTAANQALAQANEALEETNEMLRRYRIQRGQLTLEIQNARALVGARDAGLTKKEFSILLHLVQNEGKELPPEQIYEAVWGAPALGGVHTVRMHIMRLRAKLGVDFIDEFDILTMHGKGYLFVFEP
ncbi:MAG: winged helix-turn-helix domain-containing protein [Christensenellaceae bacterium]|jgi:DNA-binding winged helix-turn-helix (wHTH) protein|nr:winged helix-turn-helix domain-containing protein [Christensenellaceae bacterium]